MVKPEFKFTFFVHFALLIFAVFPVGLTGQDSIQLTKKHPEISLLNSYHKGYKWTDDISQGIKDGLPPGALLHTEYLDTKRNPLDEIYFAILYRIYKFKIEKHQFDLIICSDNNAVDFALRCKDSIKNFHQSLFAATTN
jgi:hypothetical protein